MELERDKRERDARERDMRERELRELEYRKQDLELKPGMENMLESIIFIKLAGQKKCLNSKTQQRRLRDASDPSF